MVISLILLLVDDREKVGIDASTEIEKNLFHEL
jgi:hypothetical protein